MTFLFLRFLPPIPLQDNIVKETCPTCAYVYKYVVM